MKQDIRGVAKLGQLKRIQFVLYKNWKLEKQFDDRNWKDEMAFILKGKGQPIPVNFFVDVSDDDLIMLLENAAMKYDNNENSINAKKKIESVLKLWVIQETNHILSNPK